jgi:hypothetical protein
LHLENFTAALLDVTLAWLSLCQRRLLLKVDWYTRKFVPYDYKSAAAAAASPTRKESDLVIEENCSSATAFISIRNNPPLVRPTTKTVIRLRPFLENIFHKKFLEK